MTEKWHFEADESKLLQHVFSAENCSLMVVSFSHLYQQITPSKYAHNQPKRCALVSRVNEQNFRVSLGPVQELGLIIYLGQIIPNCCRLGFVIASKVVGERGHPSRGGFLSKWQTNSKQEIFQKTKFHVFQGNDFRSPMQKRV